MPKAGVLLSSPAAAQRCAKGAGLDSGAPAAAQSAMPSIALPATASTADHFFTNAAAPAAPQFQSRISTTLTDVTDRKFDFSGKGRACARACGRRSLSRYGR
jgi:hypothetical protein